MNTLICMQGPVITRLTRKIDEYLNMSDSPVTEEARAQFLTKVMKVDFTTLQSFRNIDAIFGDEELFNAYLEFSNAVLDSWQKSPSFKSVEVLTVDMVNVRIAADVI
jgi:hypothetical protein